MDADDYHIEVEEVEIAIEMAKSGPKLIYDSTKNDFYDAYIVEILCNSKLIYKFAVPVELFNEHFKTLL